MIRKIKSEGMGKSELGWLHSTFHFSFAEYFNRENMNFGVLRVLNHDFVESKEGFSMHPHRDMEIVSYVINGKLAHKDSMGNEEKLERGQIQYMSAGTGVWHSEYNREEEGLEFLQIWILPDKEGYKPSYGDFRFNFEDRRNEFLHMVSSKEGKAPVLINSDINMYSTILDEKKSLDFKVEKGRQLYLVCIEGLVNINGETLKRKDAMEVVEEDIKIEAIEESHMLLIEMAKEEL